MRQIKSFIYFLLSTCLVFCSLQYTSHADPAASLANADPVIKLIDYEITDGVLEIGNDFTIKGTIRNCNRYADAFNVIVDVSSQDLSLRLEDESVNQLYFETIPAGQSVSFEQTFSIGKTYPYDNAMLTYTFYYSNAATKEFDNRTIITPKVIAPSKLTINVLSVAGSATVGSRSLINVRCTNSGDNDISNIVMHIEGDVEAHNKSIDLGSLVAGDQLMQDCYVTFQNIGENTLKISFSYFDSDGNEYQIEPKEHTVNVKASSNIHATVTKDGLIPKKIWRILELVLIILVMIMVYRRTKSSKNIY